MKFAAAGSPLRHPGVGMALGSALLFGASTPLAKALLTNVGPWMLAGLLYLGAGLGLLAIWLARGRPSGLLPRAEVPWLVGAVICGGLLAPVLLMLGLSRMPATGASLLLNTETVFTVLLAWILFKENADGRIAAGVVAILAGSLVLSWPGHAQFAGIWPILAVTGACFLWAADNNLTRQISSVDPTWIAMVKGLTAGSVNLALAFSLGATTAAASTVLGALCVGFLTYGASLSMFVVALRLLGTARTGAYFSVAPFFGAALAVTVLGEAATPQLVVAGSLMALGVWLHLTEKHEHRHTHPEVTHAHSYHTTDDHHGDALSLPCADGKQAVHRHPAQTHSHRHYPDVHHRHDH